MNNSKKIGNVILRVHQESHSYVKTH